MRIVIISALTFVVGAVLGGLPVRSELRAAELALTEAEECVDSGAGSELSSWFAGRPMGARSERAASPSTPEPTSPEPSDEEDEADGFEVIEIEVIEDQPDEPSASTAPDENFELAQEALDLRRTQAYASLLEDADPSDGQLADIDDALARMNDDLIGLADELIAEAELSGEPSRRDMMSFGAEALDIFVAADDAMHDTLSEEQLEAVQDEAIDPFSHVDPALMERFAELQRLGVR